MLPYNHNSRHSTYQTLRELYIFRLWVARNNAVALTVAAVAEYGRVDAFALRLGLEQGWRDGHLPANDAAVAVEVVGLPDAGFFRPWE